eukprot:3027723-Karenia_brevis.AAC.1
MEPEFRCSAWAVHFCLASVKLRSFPQARTVIMAIEPEFLFSARARRVTKARTSRRAGGLE